MAAIRALALAYYRHGKYTDSEPLWAKLVAIQRRTLGNVHGQTLDSIGGLATTYAQERKFNQSMDLLKELLDAQRRTNAPMIQVTLWTTGWVHLQTGRLDEAHVAFREALSIVDQTMPDSWERFAVQSMIGLTLAAQHKYTEAEPLLLSGYEGMKTRPPVNALPASLFPLTRVSDAITKFYRDSGQSEKAVAWERSQ
jgi:non-specific serine/threonine protein kinase/serine/threonine-protein kinase